MTSEQALLAGILMGILVLIWLELRERNNRDAIRRATKRLKDKTDELKNTTDSMGGE